MIIRTYILLGIVLLGGTGWFIVGNQPPTVQAVPVVAEVTRLQDAGIFPTGAIEENPEIDHGIFETPPEDEEHLQEATQNMDMPGMNMGGMNMGGMNMGGMNMGGTTNTGENSSMDMSDGSNATTADSGKALDMDMNGDGVMDMPSSDMKPAASGSMNLDSPRSMANSETGEGTQPEGDATTVDSGKMPDMDMNMNGDGVRDMASSNMPGTNMTSTEGAMGRSAGMAMAGDEEDAAEHMEQVRAGLVISDDGPYDREISLSMKEWTFSPLNIEVKERERIRFTLRNDGTLLHEFMFMTMAEMQAINYRAKRADWSLFEHEALFEKAILLPGQEMTFVATITKPGSWMFMCMLPYHMQMGMMGQMATPGAAMKM